MTWHHNVFACHSSQCEFHAHTLAIKWSLEFNSIKLHKTQQQSYVCKVSGTMMQQSSGCMTHAHASSWTSFIFITRIERATYVRNGNFCRDVEESSDGMHGSNTGISFSQLWHGVSVNASVHITQNNPTCIHTPSHSQYDIKILWKVPWCRFTVP